MVKPLRSACIVLTGLLLASVAAAEWAQFSAGNITVEYVWPGDEQLARESLDVLHRTLEEFEQTLPGGDLPITVTICRTIQQFKQRAGQYGRPWVGGISKTPSGQIAVKAPYLLPEPGDYEGILRHELLHVLLSRNVDDAHLPRWLNEGIVMVLSKEHRFGSMARVARMYMSRKLIPYHQLDFAFLPLGDEVISGDAYAEALSMTRYLIKRLGEDAFWGLVRSMRAEPFESALLRTTGLDPGQLYQAWRKSLWLPAVLITAGSIFSAFDIMVLLVFIAWFRKRRQNKLILARWEEDEADWANRHWRNEYVSPDEWQEEEDE